MSAFKKYMASRVDLSDRSFRTRSLGKTHIRSMNDVRTLDVLLFALRILFTIALVYPNPLAECLIVYTTLQLVKDLYWKAAVFYVRDWLKGREEFSLGALHRIRRALEHDDGT